MNEKNGTKNFNKVNTIIQILTEQRNNALNQVVALQTELIETKTELQQLIKQNETEMMDKQNDETEMMDKDSEDSNEG